MAAKTWIALFRAINVGGHQPLPMKALTALLHTSGFTGVQTYIQSGNVIFGHPTGTASSLTREIGELVLKHHRFSPAVQILSRGAFEKAVAANPFPEAADNPKAVHVYFLDKRPASPDLAGIERLRAGQERYHLEGNAFYLYTPEAFNTSKLAARAERLLGVNATARNWRTVDALRGMLTIAPAERRG